MQLRDLFDNIKTNKRIAHTLLCSFEVYVLSQHIYCGSLSLIMACMPCMFEGTHKVIRRAPTCRGQVQNTDNTAWWGLSIHRES